jgi:hypothetical protein
MRPSSGVVSGTRCGTFQLLAVNCIVTGTTSDRATDGAMSGRTTPLTRLPMGVFTAQRQQQERTA